MSKLLCCGAAALLFLTAAQAASDQVIEKPLIAQTLEGFNREAAAIRDGMKPGGRYEFLKDDDRSRVDARLDSMQALLQGHAGQNSLDSNDKVRLANLQEEVNGILKHNDSNRLVCEHRAPVGSHIPVTTCRTFGELERQRREARKEVEDMSRSGRQPPHVSGGH